MFLPLRDVRPVWQRNDTQTQAGTAVCACQPVLYVSLGTGTVGAADLKSLTSAVRRLDEAPLTKPLLLGSECSGFEAGNSDIENAEVALWAGQFRRVLDETREKGRLLVSVTATVSVGGVFLMQALAANRRAAMVGTRFYDTVPLRDPVPLEAVCQAGLLDAVVTPEALSAWLKGCWTSWPAREC